jgi:tetratricopeptide (TPR) repeat protein
MDPYAACPCGSGKKFKWCCQPIYDDINRAYQQDQEGQHDTALRIMDELVAAHADNPEAWGRRAELLVQNNRLDDAETSLAKALELNPNYPFGHYLRGEFRRLEGALPGALLLFRKAAELYDPQAREILGHIYMLIFDTEMKLNRPVAARAAAELSFRASPNADLKKGIDDVFGAGNANLPAAARAKYVYKPLAAGASADRRAAWDKALSSAGTGKLADAVRAYEQLTQDDPNDTAAWYNLAISQAWLGNNPAAVEALDRYVALEPDEQEAAKAWTLAEVLLCGQGMEDQADFVEYSVTVPLRDPQQFVNYLQELQQQGLVTGTRVSQEEGILMGVMLEAPPPALTPELAAKQNPRIGAYIVFMGGVVRLWHTNKESLGRTFGALRQKLGPLFAQEPLEARGPVKFTDVLSGAIIAVRGATSQEEATARMREHFEKYFEEEWIHHPRKSLRATPPVDAVGHPVLRKKLRGIVQFLQECGAGAPFLYDFDRLRRKLNLIESKAEATSAGAGPDIGGMAASELAALAVDTLNDAQMEEAFLAAVKLDARDLAGRFAQTLVERPARADKPDRWVWHNHLIQLAMNQGNLDAALDRVNAGEKDDCEHNEGRRRNDFELRRAQVHAKRGEPDQAQDAFDRLIARVPGEMKFRTTAAETMLSSRQIGRARQYAEAGLAEARKQNNRDLEGHFLELLDAVKRQGG